MARKRSAEKAEFWRSMVQCQRREGLTVREFCRSNSISENSFYTWRKELKRRDAELENDDESNGRRGRTKFSDRLIPVTILNEGGRGRTSSNRDSSLPIEIGTPDGFTLRFDHQTSAETVSRLLEVIVRCPPCETDKGAMPC